MIKQEAEEESKAAAAAAQKEPQAVFSWAPKETRIETKQDIQTSAQFDDKGGASKRPVTSTKESEKEGTPESHKSSDASEIEVDKPVSASESPIADSKEQRLKQINNKFSIESDSDSSSSTSNS